MIVQMKNNYKNVEEYIKSYPKDIQELLKQFQTIILSIAPDIKESISYGMPAYKLNGRPLVYFSAFKNHIGFFATPTGHAEFAKELLNYKHGKGSVQFPLDKAMPFDLISKIVKFRVNENLNKIKNIPKK
jgi:uncharacterized protein YdhG (YjbR/CyaY superfamily)